MPHPGKIALALFASGVMGANSASVFDRRATPSADRSLSVDKVPPKKSLRSVEAPPVASAAAVANATGKQESLSGEASLKGATHAAGASQVAAAAKAVKSPASTAALNTAPVAMHVAGEAAVKKADPKEIKGTPALAKPMRQTAPEQGYHGPDVKHVDGETYTDDWGKEFGPNGPKPVPGWPPKAPGSIAPAPPTTAATTTTPVPSTTTTTTTTTMVVTTLTTTIATTAAATTQPHPKASPTTAPPATTTHSSASASAMPAAAVVVALLACMAAEAP
mmetsp:Transcript_125198/g.362255  ORF Transcript_125198/g.362255 Transcript_125198/m.362255 type:complete len:277 (-) Transcript_125198:112-942(-)